MMFLQELQNHSRIGIKHYLNNILVDSEILALLIPLRLGFQNTSKIFIGSETFAL